MSDDTAAFDGIGFTLALFLIGVSVWMRLDPSAMEGATVGGRYGFIKTILVESWGPTGSMAFLGLGLLGVAWTVGTWWVRRRRGGSGAP